MLDSVPREQRKAAMGTLSSRIHHSPKSKMLQPRGHSPHQESNTTQPCCSLHESLQQLITHGTLQHSTSKLPRQMVSPLRAFYLHQQAGPANVQSQLTPFATSYLLCRRSSSMGTENCRVQHQQRWNWKVFAFSAHLKMVSWQSCASSPGMAVSVSGTSDSLSALHIYHTCEPRNYMVPLACPFKNECNRFFFYITPYFFSFNIKVALASVPHSLCHFRE